MVYDYQGFLIWVDHLMFPFKQVVTLSSDGKVTWWVVVQVTFTNTVMEISISKKNSSYGNEEGKIGVSPHTGAAPWARVALNRAATIDVATTLYG